MMQAKWQQEQEDSYSISGELNRDSVPELWRSLQKVQFSTPSAELSLQGLTRIDSAGMVMLIHLIENAKKQNCHIMLCLVPDQLRTLFQLSNVDELMAQHIK